MSREEGGIPFYNISFLNFVLFGINRQSTRISSPRSRPPQRSVSRLIAERLRERHETRRFCRGEVSEWFGTRLAAIRVDWRFFFSGIQKKTPKNPISKNTRNPPENLSSIPHSIFHTSIFKKGMAGIFRALFSSISPEEYAMRNSLVLSVCL